MLGALGDDDFESNEQTLGLTPGDVIVSYTDGAIEARNRAGQLFGIDRLRDLLQSRPEPGNWPQYIASSVDRHKVGRAEDDVLVASLTFAAVRPQRLIAKPAMSGS
jgi:serine phosphatase RsbU (regulator of sigma subunit)